MTTREAFTCRGCGCSEAAALLEMGSLPLANAFVRDPGDTDDYFRENLTLVMCTGCSLIQIRDEVPPERMFSSYLWVTGTSQTTKDYARWFAKRLRERHLEREGPMLVEIASNDGFFLEHYRDEGFDILGVDPSNLAQEADARGVPSIRAFFGRKVADRIVEERGHADVMVARNVLGHTNSPRDLVDGIKRLLAPHGACLIESPYAFFLRSEVQYDTIFHEHLSYLTVGSVRNLLASFELKVTDVSFVAMNGGSFLFEVRHAAAPQPRGDQAMLDFETLIGLNTPKGWREFSEAVTRQRSELRDLLGRLAGESKRVVGYGAAAKAMTMLNYCGITPDLLSAIADANPRKQGLLCPGVRIPVVSPKELMDPTPDYVLIAAWNFKDEIVRYLRTDFGYRNAFIVPLPTPRIVDGA
jgi:SAM-dependent methyltransferase